MSAEANLHVYVGHGLLNPRPEVCWHESLFISWWGSLLRTSASHSCLPHPECRVQTDPPNVETTSRAPLSQWENWLWHTLPGQRPGAHRNQQKQGCDGARAAAAVRQRAPVAAETSVPTLGLDPVLVQFIRVTLPKTLYLSESQPLTKTELSRLIWYSRNGLSLGST